MTEAIHVSQATQRVTVRNCANHPNHPEGVAPGLRPSWRLTGHVVTYRGDEYGEIEVTHKGPNAGAGTGKYVRMSDLDGRREQVNLREVTLAPCEGM